MARIHRHRKGNLKMFDLNIKMLSIPAHFSRNCITLGHLETRGFPISNMLQDGRFKIYNGFDSTNYKTNYDLIQAVIDEGIDTWKIMQSDEQKEKKPIPYWAIEWGFLKLMQKIVEDDTPALVLESDVFFVEMTYDQIIQQWRELVELVGYDTIKFAMLYFRKRENLPWAKPITEFWAEGVNGSGQVANIATPHGAQFMLDRKGEPWLNIENYLPEYPNTPGFYTAQRSQCKTHQLASLIYPIRNKEKFENFNKLMEGEQL